MIGGVVFVVLFSVLLGVLAWRVLLMVEVMYRKEKEDKKKEEAPLVSTHHMTLRHRGGGV